MIVAGSRIDTHPRQRFPLPGVLLLLACVIAGCKDRSAPVPPTAVAADAAGLTVEGSAFVLKTEDGRRLRGTALQGATLYLAAGGDVVIPVRLDSVSPDPDAPDLLRHDFRAQNDAGEWVPLCTPNAAGETWGFPVALPEGHPGREHAITLTCVSGAVGKCARFGYRPWARGAQGEDLLPYHAACVHMVRADYAGDGQAATRDGTAIDIYDRLGIQRSETANDPAFAFEAGWGPGGAICVGRTRWPDLLEIGALRQRHPGRFDAECDEAKARAAGALLFNRSQRH